jgi:hypothetical protein
VVGKISGCTFVATDERYRLSLTVALRRQLFINLMYYESERSLSEGLEL